MLLLQLLLLLHLLLLLRGWINKPHLTYHPRNLVRMGDTHYLSCWSSDLLPGKARPDGLNKLLLLRSRLLLISGMRYCSLKDSLLLLLASPPVGSGTGTHHSYPCLRLLLLLPGSSIPHHGVLLQLLFQMGRQVGRHPHSWVRCRNGERLLLRRRLRRWWDRRFLLLICGIYATLHRSRGSGSGRIRDFHSIFSLCNNFDIFHCFHRRSRRRRRRRCRRLRLWVNQQGWVKALRREKGFVNHTLYNPIRGYD